jgi:cytochrome c oxidase cbb3-type subunit 3
MNLRRPRRYAVLTLGAVLAVNGAAVFATDADDRDSRLLSAARDTEIVKVGKEVYAALCKSCHGEESVQVDSPSNLFDKKWHHGGKPAEIEGVVARGLLEKGMPAWGEVLPVEDVTAVVAYLLSLQPTAPRSAE